MEHKCANTYLHIVHIYVYEFTCVIAIGAICKGLFKFIYCFC